MGTNPEACLGFKKQFVAFYNVEAKTYFRSDTHLGLASPGGRRELPLPLDASSSSSPSSESLLCWLWCWLTARDTAKLKKRPGCTLVFLNFATVAGAHACFLSPVPHRSSMCTQTRREQLLLIKASRSLVAHTAHTPDDAERLPPLLLFCEFLFIHNLFIKQVAPTARDSGLDPCQLLTQQLHLRVT